MPDARRYAIYTDKEADVWSFHTEMRLSRGLVGVCFCTHFVVGEPNIRWSCSRKTGAYNSRCARWVGDKTGAYCTISSLPDASRGRPTD